MKIIVCLILVSIVLIQAQEHIRNLQIRPFPGRQHRLHQEHNETDLPPFDGNHTHNQTHNETHENRTDFFNRSSENIDQNRPERPQGGRPQGTPPNRPPHGRRGIIPKNRRRTENDRPEGKSTESNEISTIRRAERNENESRNEGDHESDRGRNRACTKLSALNISCKTDTDCSAALPFATIDNIQIVCDLTSQFCTCKQ